MAIRQYPLMLSGTSSLYTNAPEMRGARYDDKTIRDPVFRTVFDNPFYADGFFLPFGKSDEACSFMVHIRQWYWN
jgi:hypothetical protein